MGHFVVRLARTLAGLVSLVVMLASGPAWAGTELSASEVAAQASPFSFVMSAADIPTLGEWAVIGLMFLMGAYAVWRLRRNRMLLGGALGLLLLASSGALLATGGLASAVHDPATMLGAPNGHSRSVSVSLTADAGQAVTGMKVHYRKAGGAWKVKTGAAAPSGACPNCWTTTMDTTGWAVGDMVQYYFEALVGGASVFAYWQQGCSQPVDPANGTYASCDNTASWGTCALTCVAGYTKSGDATCTLGAWDTQTCDPDITCPGAPMVDNGNGTVTDPCSNLVWQKTHRPNATQANAITYCNNNTAGLPGSGWHLPNISELRSLIRGCAGTVTGGTCAVVDPTCLSSFCWSASCACSSESCCWDASVFGGSCSTYYWSSSLRVASPLYAWFVRFDYGLVNYEYIGNDYGVRCVRAGP